MEPSSTVTDHDQTRPLELSDSQLLAIDVLLTGGTHRAASEAAGVARTTVTEWVNHRGVFRSELERRRYERAGEVNDRVCSLVTRSLGVIEEHFVGADRHLLEGCFVSLRGLAAMSSSFSTRQQTDVL